MLNPIEKEIYPMKEFFQKMIAFFLALLAALGIGLKSSDEPAIILSEDDGYTVNDNTVSFAFASNPSTGYSWEVKKSGKSVKQTKEWYESGIDERGDLAIAGRSGTQFYTFTAVAAGKTTLTFTYERAWEKEVEALKTYVVCITVSDDLKISDVAIQQ